MCHTLPKSSFIPPAPMRKYQTTPSQTLPLPKPFFARPSPGQAPCPLVYGIFLNTCIYKAAWCLTVIESSARRCCPCVCHGPVVWSELSVSTTKLCGLNRLYVHIYSHWGRHKQGQTFSFDQFTTNTHTQPEKWNTGTKRKLPNCIASRTCTLISERTSW